MSFKDNAGATKDQFELYSNQNTKILVYSGKKIWKTNVINNLSFYSTAYSEYLETKALTPPPPRY